MSIVNMNADKSATVVAFSASTLTRPKFRTLPPLSLYVHIPWCLKKCPYCDFNSHEARDDMPEGAYVDALLADLEFALRDDRDAQRLEQAGKFAELAGIARRENQARDHVLRAAFCAAINLRIPRWPSATRASI